MKWNLKKKIVSLAVVPVLLLGLLIIGITLTTVKSSLLGEIRESLKGTASTALAAYDQNAGDYIEAANGDIWKGAYNISKSESLVDSIKENSGMDVTFFYGDKRIMTSALNKNGERILGSPAGSIVADKVLKQGEEYFSQSVSLDGTLNYGYFVPVYQKGNDAPIGMVFAGVNKEVKDKAVNQIIYTIIIAIAVVMIICSIIAALIAGALTRGLKQSIGLVETVARGELGVEVNAGLLRRKDEVGDLSRALQLLKNELVNIITQITSNVSEILAAAEKLDTTARETTTAMHGVGNAVNMITDSAARQAKSSQYASENMTDMGEKISRTAKEVNVLNENATWMQSSSENAAKTMKELRSINDEVQKSVALITEQTNQTNSSAQKIREAASIIADIAEETNLLSLNASIEAARAGESGRGFAVVAAQIQKLAEQSNQSGNEIEEVIAKLIEDSDKAVSTMQYVQKIIDEQNENMIHTEEIVEEVTKGIDISLKSIGQIGSAASELEVSRNQIVRTVDDLSEIARQNEQTTCETNETTGEVIGSFEQVEESAQKLKGIASELAGSMEHFRM